MPMNTIQELAATATTDVRGSAYSGYVLEPAVWEKEIIDAARKKWFFTQFMYSTTLTEGQKDAIVPKRKVYGITWQATVGENTDVNYSTLDNLDAVTFTPLDTNYAIAISNRALRVNALDLLRAAKDELTYKAGDVVDIAVASALKGATASTSTTRGAQTIYGGDARAESELRAGDIFTTDMVADAKTKLQSTICKYWVPAAPADEASSSSVKNPWTNDSNEPFVLFIAPEQENILLKDSQFVNAAEYGSDKVIATGEIGEYLGIKVVVSPNVPTFVAGAAALDGGAVVGAGATGHRCMMLKARRSGGIAWGRKPRLHVFDYPSQLQQRLVLEQAYAAKTIHDDAIVFIDVSDQ